MPVSDETLTKIAQWLYDFDYSGEDAEFKHMGNKEQYIPDAKDLVEKCGLNDESA